MFKGTVNFSARIRGSGLNFPDFEYKPGEQGVDRVVVVGSPVGDVIRLTVHFASVASREEARTRAAKLTAEALNRISFCHALAIGNARHAGDQFIPLNADPQSVYLSVSTTMCVSGSCRLIQQASAEQMRAMLERASPTGEQSYGLFRSARQSEGPVEEFMHLYNLLLMIFTDEQAGVDAFIRAEDPHVPQTLSPKFRGVMETAYTRLRNELAHKRAGVNLEDTKKEMAGRVGGLVLLTKRAIETNP